MLLTQWSNLIIFFLLFKRSKFLFYMQHGSKRGWGMCRIRYSFLKLLSKHDLMISISLTKAKSCPHDFKMGKEVQSYNTCRMIKELACLWTVLMAIIRFSLSREISSLGYYKAWANSYQQMRGVIWSMLQVITEEEAWLRGTEVKRSLSLFSRILQASGRKRGNTMHMSNHNVL